ncbi:MAG TPA: FAD-binding protein [Acidimicrobiales bacterium]|nr:FAD-binding protein [Acidimicrobiales bacterium]
MGLSRPLADFAAEVGAEGPVAVVGGRTQWDVGGPVAPDARLVSAPAGVVDHQPADMTVRVGAGTTVAELTEALAAAGQFVPLDPAQPGRATVGGVLSVGHSGLRRLRYGPVRDTLLEARYVSAAGRLVKAGGPVVKNVSGFDLCRLLVGALGTLGLLAEVVLRVQPVPAARRWLRGRADPDVVLARLYRPSSVLWDGDSVWVLVEGHPADVAELAGRLAGFAEVDGPPPLPAGGRLSVAPTDLNRFGNERQAGTFLAEVGVGTVHLHDKVTPPSPEPSVLDLNHRVRAAFDPDHRFNPGRRVA